MRRLCLVGLTLGLTLLGPVVALADEPSAKTPPRAATKPGAKEAAKAPVGFFKDVAPILVQNCIACHNPKKAESKYVMTSFALLAKGGAQAEGGNLEPGDPDASRFVELLRPDGTPRMPYKQDPLSPGQLALIERWVKEGAKYDGASTDEDWTRILRKRTPLVIPESYPVAMPITALAFSPNGMNVAASGYHEVTLWKTADGTLVRRMQGLAERIHEVAYSPDGQWLAIASGDPGLFGSVKLLSAEPGGFGKPARDLLETSDSALAVAFSPDSKRLAAAGADRAVRIWEVASGKPVAVIEDHADWVSDLAFSPDGKRIVTASRDKTCKVFDVDRKESLATFPGHAQPVHAVAFSPDGALVASGGDDNLVRFWKAGEDAQQVRQASFGGAVLRLQYAPDGKTLLGASADTTVKVLNPTTGATVRTLAGHTDWVYTVAVSRDGKTVASGAWNGEVRLWSLADGKLLRSFIAAPGHKAIAK
jgi:WD40 repeat protein